MQIPKIEMYGFHGQAQNGSLLWTSEGRFLAGGVDKNLYDRVRFKYGAEGREVFAAEEVIHARLTPYLTPVPTGYGVPARYSSRKITDIVMMCTDDAAVARKLATFNRLHHKFGMNTSKEEFDAYVEKLKKEEPQAWQQFATRGDVEIVAVDAKNNQLQEIKDLHLHIDTMELGLGYPLALIGFRADRVTRETMARLEERLNATIRAQNDLEEWGLLRPLVWRILYFMGKGDLEFDIVWPRGPRLGDQNKFAKRVYTEVQLKVLSRRRGLGLLYDYTDEEIDANFDEIAAEMKKLGDPGKSQADPEGAMKGGKGVENEDTANQNITDTENISDEDK